MRNSYERLSLFIKLNFGITLLLFLAFLSFNKYTLSTFIYTLIAAVSTAALLYLLYYLFFAPLFWLRKKTLVITAIVFTVTNVLLVIDFFIYRVWHFHINGMVLNIMFSPASYDSVKTGWLVKFAVVFVFSFFIYLQFYLVRHVSQADISHIKKRNRKLFAWGFPFLFLLVFSEKVFSGFAVMYANIPFLERTKPIPLYMGVDFTADMEKYFGLKGNPSKEQKLNITGKSKIKYPLEPLSFDKINPVNIFVFAMDSTRYDMVNQEVMPNITAFSKDSWVYQNHFSGGNTTRFGIFSLWYGLNANYWFSFLNAQKGPVFFDVLNKLGYQSHIFSSSSAVWPEFRKTTYFNMQNKLTDEHKKGYVQNDIDTSNEFISWLDSIDKNKPAFSFVFFDAPHGPYSFPKEFAKYKPYDKGDVDYLSLSEKDAGWLLNKYKNANAFSDSLVQKMFEALKKKGIYDKSIIIITSDHGEEFYEMGTFGHNNTFNKMQTHIPFIVRWPGGGHKEIKKLTSGLDLTPTLLKYIGVKTAPEKYSMGKDLLDKDFNRDFVFIGNWNNNAMLTNEYTYVFSNVNFFDSKVHLTKNYKVVPAPVTGEKEKILLNVLDENSRFIQ